MSRLARFFLTVSFFVTSQTASAQSAAATTTKSGEDYQYPELLVSPSASDRLRDEAKDEDRRAWTVNIPMQLSAASTLIAGLVAMADPGKSSGNEETVTKEDKDRVQWAGRTGVIVGGAWLGASAMMSMKYRPYKSGEKEIGKAASGDKKQQLARERLAEEALEAPALLQRRLKWISLVTNLGAAGFMASSAGDAPAKVSAGIAGIMAFTPLMFRNQWENTWMYQESYKKKVYGPLTGLGFAPDAVTGAVKPVVNLSWNF